MGASSCWRRSSIRTFAPPLAKSSRGAIADRTFGTGDATGPGSLTVSNGVAAFPEDGDTTEALVASADERLYRAKETGRDRVVV